MDGQAEYTAEAALKTNNGRWILEAAIPLGISTLIIVILITLGTDQPLRAMNAFFLAPFSNSYYGSSLLSLSSLLLLSGLGVSIAFSSGSFNLGGEGQSYAGGLAAALILLYVPQIPGFTPLILLLALACAVLVAVILGWISGILKTRLNIEPLISSFLLSSAIIPLMDGLIIGPLRDQQSNLLSMPALADAYRLPALESLPRIHAGIPIAIAIWLAVVFWFRRSKLGFEFKVTGANREFAGHSGINVKRIVILGMVLSALFHAVAGFIALTAVSHAAILGFSSGIGWNGIAVSLIAGNRREMLPLGSLVFAYLITASNAAMVYTNFSFELSALIQALVFLTVTGHFVIRRKTGGSLSFTSRVPDKSGRENGAVS